MDYLTIVPDSPEYIKGITKVREDIIPIVDLGKKMNLESEKDKNKVIIVSLQDMIVGLLVEQIEEIVKVDKIDSSKILKASQKVNRDFIKGILTHDDNLVIVIDLEKLFNNFKIDLN